MRATRLLLVLMILPLLTTACRQEQRDIHTSTAPRADQSDTAPPNQAEPEQLEGPAAPLLPRKLLFATPERFQPQISPDGRRLAFVAPWEGVFNVWVGPTDDLDAAQPVTLEPDPGVRSYFWAFTNQHILYYRAAPDGRGWSVMSVNVDSGERVALAEGNGISPRIQQLSHEFPEDVLLGINDREARFHDLYRVNVKTGDRELVTYNDNFNSFVTDKQFKLRLAERTTSMGSATWYRLVDVGWTPFAVVPPEDYSTTRVVDFGEEGTVMYTLDSRERDRAILTGYDFKAFQEHEIAADPKADLSLVITEPTTGAPQAVRSTYLRQRWQCLDLRFQADLEVLRSLGDANLDITSRTQDDEQWLVLRTTSNGPGEYYLYDRQQREPKLLFVDRPELADQPLPVMHSMEVAARDGLPLTSYLTLPFGSDVDGDGRPAKPLPMVLLVHAGPWARDVWGYQPYHQQLANRGYAVLSVNYRGSGGFGKEFLDAGNGEWGRAMQDDLIDAVRWAISEGITEEGRVALMGRSYGGYATLMGLIQHPELFACGVDIMGPTDLLTLLESIPTTYTGLRKMHEDRIGNPSDPAAAARMEDTSPLNHADRINRPLLIAQGALDRAADEVDTLRLVRIVAENQVPVTMVRFPEERHGFGS
jgi:dipeptidyl aminopeptidase/acylaminoacyl peptidase